MPTATISGTTDIDDTCIVATNPDDNAGALTTQVISSTAGAAVGLWRVATAQIPAGVITAVRMLFSTGAGNGTISAYSITDANVWGEGTGTFTAANNGEATWNNARHGVAAWAGSAGCGTSGTDFRADASPPTVAVTSFGNFTLSLPTAWFTNWRDGTWVNNGFRTVATALTRILPTENASPPTFEIDYSTVRPAYYNALLSRIRR